MFKQKMDKLKGDFDVYNQIFITSSSVMIVLVQIYLILITNGVDWVNFSNVESIALRVVLQVLVQIVGFSLINVAVFAVVYKVREKRWISTHKEMWIKGEWLHIHDKKNVRIGKVSIQQRFSSIEVSGDNIAPNVCGNIKTNTTKWHYQSAKLYRQGPSDIQLVGSYMADKKEKETYSLGVHFFDNIKGPQNGYPVKMLGRFSDTFKVSEDTVKDIGDKKGDIVLHKMTPLLRKHISDENGMISEEKLANVVYDKEVENEEFVKDLKRVLEKHGYTLDKAAVHN